ncbi:Arrestin C-terminal-like domain [Fusarium oxysporum f. sp. vasinfectum]|nr:Arrestin C-terminal-like domain [Fusarium oxysporum f. sp. vasinfectum]
MSVQPAEFTVASLVPKPVASGSGVTCSILLAEHDVLLSGFDLNGNGHRVEQSGAALLRGKLQLHVSKNVKIKAVKLKLLGLARTEWPDGMKLGYYEEEILQTQVVTFFNAMNNEWKCDYGNQCTYRLENTRPSSTNQPNQPKSSPSHCHDDMSVDEMRQLHLQSVRSAFYPGTYDYSFELPIDHHQLETTKVQYGSVKWELHATVDRVGVFNPNLHGMKEVSILRVPDPLSLEMTECISISRQCHDQLHYDIIISGKSFPIGSKVPIAFKLMPLAKIQVHELKVFVIESIEYCSNDKRCTRKASGPKILLLNKTARKTLDPP